MEGGNLALSTTEPTKTKPITQPTMRPTREDFSRASSHPSGNGFSAAQIRLLGADPKKPWIHRFIGQEIPDELWDAFIHAGDSRREKNRVKTLNHDSLFKSVKAECPQHDREIA